MTPSDLPLFNVVEGGVPRIQHYRIPSRAGCLVCHTPQAGHALSFNTRQLNRDGVMAGVSGNQIRLLHGAGYFSNDPEAPSLLPRHVRPDETLFPVEARAWSYLAVNCVNCHQAGGTAPPSWDARPELSLARTGLIHGPAANNGGDLANQLVVPGDPAHSLIVSRTAAVNGFTRMPPIGSDETDAEGIALLTAWIGNTPPPDAGNVGPVGVPDDLSRSPGRSVKVPVASLLGNDLDPDGPAPLMLLEVASTSARGATIRRLGGVIVYESDAGDLDDSFGYTVTDGAVVALGVVNIVVTEGPAGPTRNIVASAEVDGERRFTIAGIPGRAYRLQRSGAPEGPWLEVPGSGAAGVAAPNGQAQLVDVAPPGDAPSMFYRAIPGGNP